MLRSSSKLIFLSFGAVLFSGFFSYVAFFGVPQLINYTDVLGNVLLADAAPKSVEKALPEQLFDIDVDVVVSKIVEANDLRVRVQFMSFGRVPTNVSLQYVIRDAQGAVRLSESEKITVETSYILHKNFPTLALPDGAYTVEVQTLYNTDIRDDFVVPFSIQEMRETYVLLLVILGVFGSAGVVGLLYMFIHNRGQGLRRHHALIAHHTAASVLLLVTVPTAVFLFSEIEMTQNAQAGLAAFNLEEGELHRAAALDTFLHDKEVSVQMLRESLYEVSDTHRAFAMLTDESYTAAVYVVDAAGVCFVAAQRQNDFAPQSCNMQMYRDPVSGAADIVQYEGVHYKRFALPISNGNTYVLVLSLDEMIGDIGYSGVMPYDVK